MTIPRQFSIGETVELRRPHACGGSRWLVTRVGADIGLQCLTCEHRIMLARRDLERRLRAGVPVYVSDRAVYPSEDSG